MADTAASVGMSGFLQKFKTPLVGAACFAVGFLAGRGTAPKRTAARAPASRQLSGTSAKKKKIPKRIGAGGASRAQVYELKP